MRILQATEYLIPSTEVRKAIAVWGEKAGAPPLPYLGSVFVDMTERGVFYVAAFKTQDPEPDGERAPGEDFGVKFRVKVERTRTYAPVSDAPEVVLVVSAYDGETWPPASSAKTFDPFLRVSAGVPAPLPIGEAKARFEEPTP